MASVGWREASWAPSPSSFPLGLGSLLLVHFKQLRCSLAVQGLGSLLCLEGLSGCQMDLIISPL